MREKINKDGSNISIVIQGPIQQGMLVDFANQLTHWRNILPFSQIIISISSLEGGIIFEDGNLRGNDNINFSSIIRSAMDIVNEIADSVIVCSSEKQLPLPDLKNNIKKQNNINLQISAAKMGIALAERKFILRIRNDIVFMDKKFIDLYNTESTLDRGRLSVFKKQVMICSLYTLNPFGSERLPLHISDWFNLGLLDDVKQFWDVEYLSYYESMYYKYNKPETHSNTKEMEFNSKFAVEQYNAVRFFSKKLKDLKLEFHNDLRDRDRSIDIILDNFIIVDPDQVNMYFPKYEDEFFNPEKRNDCLTHACWKFLSAKKEKKYSDILTGDIDKNIGIKNNNEMLIEISNKNLRTNEGVKTINCIYIEGDGRLFFGPYINIDPGHYSIEIFFNRVIGCGDVSISLKCGNQNKSLKSNTFTNFGGDSSVKIDLFLKNSVTLFEIVCDVKGYSYISIEKIDIMKINSVVSDASLKNYVGRSKKYFDTILKLFKLKAR